MKHECIPAKCAEAEEKGFQQDDCTDQIVLQRVTQQVFWNEVS